MGIFSRMKRAIKSKANAAIDKAIDPQKEIDMAILELENQQRAAIKELISYKATAKQLEQDIAKLEERAANWERRAMAAVKKGDDALAKECLEQKKKAEIEAGKVRRDRDEAQGYAIELNRSRKTAETKLKILKLKKGTMATQIAAARSGTGNVFGQSDAAFDKLARAEEKIDDDALMAEVNASLDGEDLEADIEARLLAAGGGDPAAGASDDPLAELKAKMEADRREKLTGGDPEKS
jgi:phage shock protein A